VADEVRQTTARFFSTAVAIAAGCVADDHCVAHHPGGMFAPFSPNVSCG
jgi:hypothetical protein